MNLLLLTAQEFILPGILVAMIIVFVVMNIVKNKKYQENTNTMIESLKKGDKVKTYSGIYGKIIEIVQTEEGKIVTLQTGTTKNPGFVSFDIRAIYAIDENKPVVVSDSTDKPVVAAEKVAEEKKEVVAEEVKEEVIEQSIQTKDKPAEQKKTTKKKSTK